MNDPGPKKRKGVTDNVQDNTTASVTSVRVMGSTIATVTPLSNKGKTNSVLRQNDESDDDSIDTKDYHGYLRKQRTVEGLIDAIKSYFKCVGVEVKYSKVPALMNNVTLAWRVLDETMEKVKQNVDMNDDDTIFFLEHAGPGLKQYLDDELYHWTKMTPDAICSMYGDERGHLLEGLYGEQLLAIVRLAKNIVDFLTKSNCVFIYAYENQKFKVSIGGIDHFPGFEQYPIPVFHNPAIWQIQEGLYQNRELPVDEADFLK